MGGAWHSQSPESYYVHGGGIKIIVPSTQHDAYGMLAYHWSRAEELDKAEDYLFKAGEEAARSAASSEALQYFRDIAELSSA